MVALVSCTRFLTCKCLDNQISAAWRQAQPNLHAVEDYRNRMCSPESEKLNNPQNLQVFKEICIE